MTYKDADADAMIGWAELPGSPLQECVAESQNNALDNGFDFTHAPVLQVVDDLREFNADLEEANTHQLRVAVAVWQGGRRAFLAHEESKKRHWTRRVSAVRVEEPVRHGSPARYPHADETHGRHRWRLTAELMALLDRLALKGSYDPRSVRVTVEKCL